MVRAKKHKEAQAKDKEGKEPRNYKRPPWASASRMKIKMGKKREYVDVEITDNWGEIKQMVCEKMEVQEKDTDMTLSFGMDHCLHGATSIVVQKRL